MRQRLVKSAFKCLTCDTVIESRSRSERSDCRCESGSDTAIFVSVGLIRQLIGYGIKAEFEDLCEWEEVVDS